MTPAHPDRVRKHYYPQGVAESMLVILHAIRDAGVPETPETIAAMDVLFRALIEKAGGDPDAPKTPDV